MKVVIGACLVMLMLSANAEARNTPCSGSKGGISHCKGHIFVCKNGTTSQSKLNCANEGGGAAKDEGSAARSRR